MHPKKLLACCTILLLCATGIAQKQSVRVFAYEIPNISGVAPVGEISVGDVIKTDGTNPKGGYADYQIFMAVSNMSNITLQRLWVKQQLFAVKLEKVPNTPLILPRGKNPGDTLVPSTSAEVWRILIASEPIKGIQPIAAIRQLVKNNEVVIRLSSKDKPIISVTLPKIKKLAPIAGS